MIKRRLKHESLGLKAHTPGLFLPKPSVLGYRPVMLGFFFAFIFDANLWKTNWPDWFYDLDYNVNELSHNIQSIFLMHFLSFDFLKIQSYHLFSMIYFFLFNLKLKKIQFHHLLSIICFYYFSPTRLSCFFITYFI